MSKPAGARRAAIAIVEAANEPLSLFPLRPRQPCKPRRESARACRRRGDPGFRRRRCQWREAGGAPGRAGCRDASTYQPALCPRQRDAYRLGPQEPTMPSIPGATIATRSAYAGTPEWGRRNRGGLHHAGSQYHLVAREWELLPYRSGFVSASRAAGLASIQLDGRFKTIPIAHGARRIAAQAEEIAATESAE